jgi:hypothetical protein
MADPIIRSAPCGACPYRRDCPSGVWAPHEYEKLRPYDEPTGSQPFGMFMCHATPDAICHGWAVVHTSQGPEYDLLALRVRQWEGDIPPPAVPLFSSGNEAADHGQAEIETPGPQARRTIDRLVRKYDRLRWDEPLAT